MKIPPGVECAKAEGAFLVHDMTFEQGCGRILAGAVDVFTPVYGGAHFESGGSPVDDATRNSDIARIRFGDFLASGSKVEVVSGLQTSRHCKIGRDAIVEPARQHSAAFPPGCGDNVLFYGVTFNAVEGRGFVGLVKDPDGDQEQTRHRSVILRKIELQISLLEFNFTRAVLSNKRVFEFQFGKHPNFVGKFVVHEQDEAMKVGFRLVIRPARPFEKVEVKFAVRADIGSLHECALAGKFTDTCVVRRIVCVCRSIYCVRRRFELCLLLLEELEEFLVARHLFGCCGDRDTHQH